MVLIHILILISSLYLSRSPVGVTELMLIQGYLYTYWYLYLSQISRMSLQNLCLYKGTLRYYKAYTYTLGLILILWSLHLFGGTRRYYRDITECILVLRNLSLYGSNRKYIKFILVLRILYLYYEAYLGLTELILILLNLFLYFGSYTYVTELIIVIRILYL